MSQTGITFMSIRDNPDAFYKVVGDSGKNWPTARQLKNESAYRALVNGKGFIDISFAIIDGSQCRGLVLAQINRNVCSFWTGGAELLLLPLDKKVLKETVYHLKDLAHSASVKSLIIKDSGNKLSTFMYQEGARAELVMEAAIDLSKSEEDIRADIRKSYKSLINQGLREIRFTAVNCNNPDREYYERFQAFHQEIAGKITRPQGSWDIHFESICSGDAVLLMGEMEGCGLVSSGLFTDFGPVTHYGVAVYDRKLFDKPLAHANVFQGIIEAKARGQKFFTLGTLPYKQDATDKEWDIAQFKKGFCSNLMPVTQWHIKI